MSISYAEYRAWLTSLNGKVRSNDHIKKLVGAARKLNGTAAVADNNVTILAKDKTLEVDGNSLKFDGELTLGLNVDLKSLITLTMSGIEPTNTTSVEGHRVPTTLFRLAAIEKMLIGINESNVVVDTDPTSGYFFDGANSLVLKINGVVDDKLPTITNANRLEGQNKIEKSRETGVSTCKALFGENFDAGYCSNHYLAILGGGIKELFGTVDNMSKLANDNDIRLKLNSDHVPAYYEILNAMHWGTNKKDGKLQMNTTAEQSALGTSASIEIKGLLESNESVKTLIDDMINLINKDEMFMKAKLDARPVTSLVPAAEGGPRFNMMALAGIQQIDSMRLADQGFDTPYITSSGVMTGGGESKFIADIKAQFQSAVDSANRIGASFHDSTHAKFNEYIGKIKSLEESASKFVTDANEAIKGTKAGDDATSRRIIPEEQLARIKQLAAKNVEDNVTIVQLTAKVDELVRQMKELVKQNSSK